MEAKSPYDEMNDRDLLGFYKICAYRKAGNPILSRLAEDSCADEFIDVVRRMWREKAEEMGIEPSSLTAREKDESDRKYRAMGEAWAAGGGREPDEILKELSARKARHYTEG